VVAKAPDMLEEHTMLLPPEVRAVEADIQTTPVQQEPKAKEIVVVMVIIPQPRDILLAVVAVLEVQVKIPLQTDVVETVE
jgi:hypothetical protein